MRTVIYQPSFIPWLGYFDLFLRSDVFVIYDDVQFTKRDWRTRNRIRTDKGWIWLSIPVKLERPYYEYKIWEVVIDHNQKWIKRHLKTLIHYYKRTKYFDEIFPIVEKIYNANFKHLEDFILELFFNLLNYMKCPKIPKIVFSKELKIPKNLAKTNRLVYIIQEYLPETEIYLTGPTARNYLDESSFKKIGVKVEWHDYEHPYYNQRMWGTNIFISHLSILDLLFNHGKESCNIILHKLIIKKPPGVIILNANDIKGGKIESEF